ncbi:hypothetical protein AK830_g4933 [Neonectria ditissima]|uniref:Uncharacterized protein n=2 Tax=Neonectria TaxID=140106 RepID=A0A0P7BK49_9HYPO|nr:hypothetical protein AK830_g4933 [Neonectria ditissima]
MKNNMERQAWVSNKCNLHGSQQTFLSQSTPTFKMPSIKTNNTKDQTNNYPLGCNVMVKPTTPAYPLGCSVMAKPGKDQNPSYPLGCTIM